MQIKPHLKGAILLALLAATVSSCSCMSCGETAAPICTEGRYKAHTVNAPLKDAISPPLSEDLQEVMRAACENHSVAPLKDAISPPLSEDLQEVMRAACDNYTVPYSLALAVAKIESNFDVDAVNGSSIGIMQIHECNHGWLRELGIEPTEYEGNIEAGVLMLGSLLEKYGDTHKALMAYNCGEAGAARLWKQGYSTSTYSRKVIAAEVDFAKQID